MRMSATPNEKPVAAGDSLSPNDQTPLKRVDVLEVVVRTREGEFLMWKSPHTSSAEPRIVQFDGEWQMMTIADRDHVQPISTHYGRLADRAKRFTGLRFAPVGYNEPCPFAFVLEWMCQLSEFIVAKLCPTFYTFVTEHLALVVAFSLCFLLFDMTAAINEFRKDIIEVLSNPAPVVPSKFAIRKLGHLASAHYLQSASVPAATGWTTLARRLCDHVHA
ncbi:hypothetical protein BDW22DRAFT_747039 [Trametopsis cervina]|nr:hypothetical protein BDW22DRAFT_747039 [Trametopsis cervina]